MDSLTYPLGIKVIPDDLTDPFDRLQFKEARMKRIKLLLLVPVLLGFAALAHADYDVAIAAYSRGDYAKAYKEFKKSAEQGRADAQLILGSIYELGEGIPQDYAEAVQWYRKAAEQGHAKAQFMLGGMYDEGKGVPPAFLQNRHP